MYRLVHTVSKQWSKKSESGREREREKCVLGCWFRFRRGRIRPESFLVKKMSPTMSHYSWSEIASSLRELTHSLVWKRYLRTGLDGDLKSFRFPV